MVEVEVGQLPSAAHRILSQTGLLLLAVAAAAVPLG
jgi:hypothetical protein